MCTAPIETFETFVTICNKNYDSQGEKIKKNNNNKYFFFFSRGRDKEARDFHKNSRKGYFASV